MDFPFEDVWQRISEELKWGKLKSLGDFLGFSSGAVSGARTRGKFPIEWAFKVAQGHGLSTDWILTGVEPRYHGGKPFCQVTMPNYPNVMKSGSDKGRSSENMLKYVGSHHQNGGGDLVDGEWISTNYDAVLASLIDDPDSHLHHSHEFIQSQATKFMKLFGSKQKIRITNRDIELIQIFNLVQEHDEIGPDLEDEVLESLVSFYSEKLTPSAEE